MKNRGVYIVSLKIIPSKIPTVQKDLCHKAYKKFKAQLETLHGFDPDLKLMPERAEQLLPIVVIEGKIGMLRMIRTLEGVSDVTYTQSVPQHVA